MKIKLYFSRILKITLCFIAFFSAIFFSELKLSNPFKTVLASEEVDELTLTLLGEEKIYYAIGTEYQEQGAIAIDPIDGDVSDEIVIDSSSIQINTAGTYTVTYSITHNDVTKQAKRTIIVEDYVYNNLYDRGSYNSDNDWDKIIKTSDGGYFLVGNMYYNSYMRHAWRKCDSNMNVVWENYSTDYYHYQYYNDVIELFKDNYVIASYNNSNGNTYIKLIYENTEIASTIISGSEFYLEKIDDSSFYLIKNGSSSHYLFTYDKGNKTFSTSSVSTSISLHSTNKQELDNDNYYSILNGNLICHNFNTNTYSNSNIQTSDFALTKNYIYSYYNSKITKLDKNLNIIESIDNVYTYSIFNSGNDDDVFIRIYNKDLYVYDKDFKVLLYKSATFQLDKSYSSTTVVFRDAIYQNQTLLSVGKYSYYYHGDHYSAAIYGYNPNYLGLHNGSNNEHISLNEQINYLSYVQHRDEEANWYIHNIDNSAVDVSRCGNYNVYYTLKEITESEIKTTVAKKVFVVEPETNLVNYGEYDTSIIVDVKGGDVTINGNPYNYGDVYSIPGDSTMVITGENGYTKTINFTIISHMYGIENNGVYYEPVTPTITGGYLFYDGTLVENGTELFAKGYHTIYYSNSPSPAFLAYNDNDNPFLEGDNHTYEAKANNHNYSYYHLEILKSGTLHYTFYCNRYYFDVLKNGSAYHSYYYESSGTNSLSVYAGDKITFVAYDNQNNSSYYCYFKDIYMQCTDNSTFYHNNDFIDTYKITIEPTIAGVDDGQVYTKSLTPNINAENMTLNGVEYNNEPITNCGYYTLIINGTNGYQKTLNFTIDTIVDGVENNGIYEGSVTPTFTKGTATLNGEPYTSGETITTPGVHNLVITGENGYSVSLSFEVVLLDKNIQNGGIYTGEVCPEFSGGDITLNDETYISGTVIDVPGNYTLIVKGANGYKKTYRFVVTPELVNVENGKTYTESLVPCVSKGRITLDGQPFTSGTLLNTSGNHTLIIIGEGGYLLKINFTLKTGANIVDGQSFIDSHTLQFIGDATLNGSPINAGDTIDTIENYQLVLTDGENTFIYNFTIEPDYSMFENTITSPVEFIFDNASEVTLNGNAYTSGTTIEKVGNYTLVVKGINGYEKSINFEILPALTIVDGESYIDSVEVTINGDYETAFIDDSEYTDSTVIDTIGKHTIKINDEIIATFFVVPSINITDKDYYFGSVTPIISGGNITLNGATFNSNTAINVAGTYKLVITGVNDYEETINFIVLPESFEVKPENTYFEKINISNNVTPMKIDGEDYLINNDFTSYGNHTLSFEYNGVSSYYTFFIIPSVDGVENGQTYMDSVTINVDWDYLLIDNQPYTSGNDYNVIGNHTLTLVGLNGHDYTIDFTIKPTFGGIENNKVYDEPVALVFSNGTATLNGKSYTSGTSINKVGNYTLTISGTNDYEETIYFTIKEVLSYIEANGTYKGSLSIYTTNNTICTLLLDNNSYSGSSFSSVGYHTITVKGEGDYENTYNFTIEPTISVYVYNGSTTTFVEGATYMATTNSNGYMRVSVSDIQSMTRNGKSYSSGSNFTEIGNHTIVIYGTNGYEKTINFTKAPYISGVEDGGFYTSSSKSITCNYAQSLTLNGDPYSSGSSFSKDGYYTFTVYGINGYEKTINFTKAHEISGITDGQEYIGHVSVSNKYIDFELDGQPYSSGSVIKTIGYHTLICRGVGGYEVTYSFTIVPQITSVVEGGTYLSTTGVLITVKDTYSGGNLSDDYIDGIDIDGYYYENGTRFCSIGYHKLTIHGTNDYKYEINFKISPQTSNLPEEYVGEAFTPTFNVGNSEFTLEINNWILSQDNIYISNNHNHSSSSSIIITVNIESSVSFYYSVSSEKNYDYIRIFKNGSQVTAASGSLDYTYFELDLNNGDIVEITYSKDSSASSGSDSGFIKDLTILAKSPSLNQEDFRITLDGKEYIPGTEINEVGNHILTVYGSNGLSTNYNITILPTITGLVDGETYFATVTPVIDYATLLLDGEEYISGTEIVEVGYHTLTIIGANGWEQLISFTITPNIQNIVNGETYIDSVTPIIDNATLLLDGEEYTSGTEIVEVGNHTITILGANGYTYPTSISFVVEPSYITYYDLNTFTDEILINKNYNETILVNGTDYNSEEIVTVGYYFFEVIGANGYYKEFACTITEYPWIMLDIGNSVLENGKTYEKFISIGIPNAILLLDEEPYTSDTIIRSVGIHYLKVIGENGYTNEYTFTIKEVIEGLEDGAEYKSFMIKCNDVEQLILNDVIIENNTLVTKTGNYILTVIGTNGYTNIYNFSISIEYTNIESGGVYVGSVTPIINSNNILLDNQPYENKTAITTIGNHVLSISEEGGYITELLFTIEPDIQGVSDRDTFTGSRHINIIGDAKEIILNGETVQQSFEANIIGNNILTIKGYGAYEKTISFTIEPDIVGLQSNETYLGSVNFDIVNIYQKLTLNGNTCNNKTLISTIGNNRLIIYGVNGYYKVIDFTIDVYFENEPDTTIYDEFLPNFIGEGTYLLNGAPYTPGTKISTIGNNQIVINGIGGYSKSFNLFIDTSLKIPENAEYIDCFEDNLPSGSYIDGKMVSLGTDGFIKYTSIGNHTLEIKGVNNYSKTFTFTVIPQAIESEYIGEVSFDINCLSMYIDGTSYQKNSKYYNPGYHTLTVYGTNGYEVSYSFLLHAVVEGINESGIYNEYAQFNTQNGTLLIDNKSYDKNSKYSVIGNHALTIYGSGDYTYTYNFTIPVALFKQLNGVPFTNLCSVTLLNTAEEILVDEVKVPNNYIIRELGDHIITIKGTNGYTETYYITIEPTIIGINDGEEYVGSVSWSIGGAATVYVDGVEMKTIDTLKVVGYHTLTLTTDTFSKDISFTILPNISAIEDGATYYNEAVFYIENALLVIDTTEYTSGNKYNSIGYHTLNIIGTNDYHQTINFTIVEENIGISNEEHYKTVTLSNLTNCLEVILDQQALSVEQKESLVVDSSGKHTLIIRGTNNYEKVYIFYIDIESSLTNDHKIYEIGQGFDVAKDVEIILNGNKVTNLNSITTVGKNKITLIGLDGYKEEFTITIKSGYDNDLINNGNYQYRLELKEIEATVKIDGKAIDFNKDGKFYLEEKGTHKITIEGANGYIEEYTVTIENPNRGFAGLGAGVIAIALGAIIFFVIKRKGVI